MRTRFRTAALVAAFFVAAPAFAMPPTMAVAAAASCVSPGEVTEAVLAQVPDAAPVTHGGAVAARLLALFNATPPVTEAAADRAIVYSTDRLAEVLVVLLQDGCRIGAMRVPRGIYWSLLRQLTGVAT